MNVIYVLLHCPQQCNINHVDNHTSLVTDPESRQTLEVHHHLIVQNTSHNYLTMSQEKNNGKYFNFQIIANMFFLRFRDAYSNYA
jgi:hypothetical protein